MTEQVPEDLTEAEEADRLDVDRSEDEGDTASEVDRWEMRAGTTAPAEPAGLLRARLKALRPLVSGGVISDPWALIGITLYRLMPAA